MTLDPGMVSMRWNEWPTEAMRAVLLAHALNAPAAELAEMVRDAASATAFVRSWARKGCRDSGGCTHRRAA